MTPTQLPQPGDFGIKPGGGLAMWLIRLGTFSRYGHACIVDAVNSAAGLTVVTIIEAMPTGVVRRPAHVSEFRWSTGGPVVPTEGQRHQIRAAAQDCLGRGYDWPSIAGFLVRFFGAKFGYSPDHPDRKLICSELVVWTYKKAGIDLFPGKAPGDISPGDLSQFCPPDSGYSV